MANVSIGVSGSFDNTDRFLKSMSKLSDLQMRAIQAQGRAGVDALIAATPHDSGLAAESWSYQITQNRSGVRIDWLNSDVENGFPVAVALQIGYATGTGGWVQGRDYINPAMRPIFDKIVDDVWKAVTSA
jgi:hypothetical protein